MFQNIDVSFSSAQWSMKKSFRTLSAIKNYRNVSFHPVSHLAVINYSLNLEDIPSLLRQGCGLFRYFWYYITGLHQDAHWPRREHSFFMWVIRQCLRSITFFNRIEIELIKEHSFFNLIVHVIYFWIHDTEWYVNVFPRDRVARWTFHVFQERAAVCCTLAAATYILCAEAGNLSLIIGWWFGLNHLSWEEVVIGHFDDTKVRYFDGIFYVVDV